MNKEKVAVKLVIHKKILEQLSILSLEEDLVIDETKLNSVSYRSFLTKRLKKRDLSTKAADTIGKIVIHNICRALPKNVKSLTLIVEAEYSL